MNVNERKPEGAGAGGAEKQTAAPLRELIRLLAREVVRRLKREQDRSDAGGHEGRASTKPEHPEPGENRGD